MAHLTKLAFLEDAKEIGAAAAIGAGGDKFVAVMGKLLGATNSIPRVTFPKEGQRRGAHSQTTVDIVYTALDFLGHVRDRVVIRDDRIELLKERHDPRKPQFTGNSIEDVRDALMEALFTPPVYERVLSIPRDPKKPEEWVNRLMNAIERKITRSAHVVSTMVDDPSRGYSNTQGEISIFPDVLLGY
jgi:hypothetical protein